MALGTYPVYLLDVTRRQAQVYNRYGIWKILTTQRCRSPKEMSRSPSAIVKRLKERALEEDLRRMAWERAALWASSPGGQAVLFF